MAKVIYHSQLRALQAVKVKVLSDVLKSKHTGNPDYVTIELEGAERYYNVENADCAKFFHGRKGQVITIQADGTREEASIMLVGEHTADLPQQPAARSNPPPTATTPEAGMRAGEVRYERTVGLPNYCSEKIGIMVFLEPGAKAADALAFAKKFVEAHLMSPGERR
jgi:hypothetical protein